MGKFSVNVLSLYVSVIHKVLHKVIVSDFTTLFEAKPRFVYLDMYETIIYDITEVVVVDNTLWDEVVIEFYLFWINWQDRT